MDPRRLQVVFLRRMQIQRVCVTIFTSSLLLIMIGVLSYFGGRDSREEAVIERNREKMPRLVRMEERGTAVMAASALTLLGLMAVSGGVMFALWRCPECGAFLRFEFSPRRCPRCGCRFSCEK